MSGHTAASGGCLCGAVRWQASAPPRIVHHCHCDMCRRWTGSAFATLVWFARNDLSWDGAAAHALPLLAP